MNTREAIKKTIDFGQFVCLGYIEDLTDADLMFRTLPEANHINWQIGHLIASEHAIINKLAPGAMADLPPGFAEMYAKEKTSSDDAESFMKKEKLLEVFHQQRAGTLAALEKETDERFDAETGIFYAPTIGEAYLMQGTHWLMHCGQWAITRRALGKPPLF